ncbi:hypothetical protein MTO96_033711 [Rhipicephalus appendiculatus]
MYSNLALLSDMRQRQELLAEGTKLLRGRINEFRETVSREVEQALTQAPLAPCSYKVPADLDVRFVPAFLRDVVLRELDDGDSLLLQLDTPPPAPLAPATSTDSSSAVAPLEDVQRVLLASGDPMSPDTMEACLPPPLQPVVVSSTTETQAQPLESTLPSTGDVSCTMPVTEATEQA